MNRVAGIVLLVALLLGLGWAAWRSPSGASPGTVDAEWAAAHNAELRRLLNLPASVELKFREVGRSPVPDFHLLLFDLVAEGYRRPLQLYVSRDARIVFYDRPYELADPFRAVREQIRLDAAPARGPAHAPVTIVEYSDFTCGFCRRFVDTVQGPMFERYGDKVRFVHKNFPLAGLRAWSEDAALAAACGFRQSNDSFWALHPRLFRETPRLRQGYPVYVELAREAGLNLPTFRRCLEKREAKADVDRDIQEGERLGVTGTPTFFINGRSIPGLVRPELFFQIVDEELAASSQ